MSQPFIVGPYSSPKLDPAWVDRLKRRQASIEQLCRGIRSTFGAIAPHSGVDDICTAIQDLLGADIAESLAEIANPHKMPTPTIEDLERAQRQVEQVQAQLEALDNLCRELPDAQAEFIRTTNRPMIQGALQHAEQWLSAIQQAIEAEPAPTEQSEASPGPSSTTQQKGESD